MYFINMYVSIGARRLMLDIYNAINIFYHQYILKKLYFSGIEIRKNINRNKLKS